jgi:putative Ca2+/H+ antiporter (TMEM165/GDT1 family)
VEALLQSFALVATSEMGDKTQLLALVLALRFKKPVPILLGILVATLANHGLATWVGTWVGSHFSPDTLRYILAGIFFAFGLWILVPDKLDDQDSNLNDPKRQTNAFLTTTILFFLAEMGDKTQLATVALGARFQAPMAVTMGTTLGMLVADGLAVVFGERLTKVVPMSTIRKISALLFVVFGAAMLVARG